MSAHAVLPDPDPCARLPVHTIGQIQPHGVLFVISDPDLIVRQVSANIQDLLCMAPDDVLGRPFEAVLGPERFYAFRRRSFGPEGLSVNPIRMRIGRVALEMDCMVYRQDGVLIVELEVRDGAWSIEPVNLDGHIRLPLSRLEGAEGIVELSQRAVQEIRTLSGFDRVMVYRFDEDWHGEVIAEATSPSPVSYLGLRFPAGDIPPQARRLFLLNRLRTIVDVAATPSTIVPETGPVTGRTLDLTYSCLRSAAPVHLEYLRNMGVEASMTVSIIVRQQLWGMIACHHSSRRRVDRSTRSVCDLIVKFLGSQLALRLDNAALHRAGDATGRENRTTGSMPRTPRPRPQSVRPVPALPQTSLLVLSCAAGDSHALTLSGPIRIRRYRLRPSPGATLNQNLHAPTIPNGATQSRHSRRT